MQHFQHISNPTQPTVLYDSSRPFTSFLQWTGSNCGPELCVGVASASRTIAVAVVTSPTRTNQTEWCHPRQRQNNGQPSNCVWKLNRQLLLSCCIPVFVRSLPASRIPIPSRNQICHATYSGPPSAARERKKDKNTCATMGQDQPYMYRPESWQSSRFPTSTFDPKAITRASWEPVPQKPKQEGPLISFNRHPE